MDQLQPATSRNRLLRALAPDDFALLRPHLQTTTTQLRETLIEPGRTIEEVYFPETGFVSIATTVGGSYIEVGLCGREGLVGAAELLLGSGTTPHEYFVQMAGEALRMEAQALCAAVERSPSLRKLLLRYVHTLMIQGAQTAYANAAINLEGRLARWLLMCHDRSDGDELVLTDEFLSMMLGVQRAGITLAIQNLEGAGRIRARRRRIQVLDREKLEALTNGSYGVPEAEYLRLIGRG